MDIGDTYDKLDKEAAKSTKAADVALKASKDPKAKATGEKAFKKIEKEYLDFKKSANDFKKVHDKFRASANKMMSDNTEEGIAAFEAELKGWKGATATHRKALKDFDKQLSEFKKTVKV